MQYAEQIQALEVQYRNLYSRIETVREFAIAATRIVQSAEVVTEQMINDGLKLIDKESAMREQLAVLGQEIDGLRWLAVQCKP